MGFFYYKTNKDTYFRHPFSGRLFISSTVVPYRPMQAIIHAVTRERTQPTTRMGTKSTVST